MPSVKSGIRLAPEVALLEADKAMRLLEAQTKIEEYGVATVNALAGCDLNLTSFLIPWGVIAYTASGGLEATFLAPALGPRLALGKEAWPSGEPAWLKNAMLSAESRSQRAQGDWTTQLRVLRPSGLAHRQL